MPTAFYQRKEVQITVYAVKPRRRLKHAKSMHEQHSGHRYHHQTPMAGAAYDRKAQLLLYSRQLRAKAWLEKTSSYKSQSQNKVKEIIQIASIHKVKQARFPISSSNKSQLKKEQNLPITSGQNHDNKVKEVRQISPAVPWKVVPAENKPSQSKLPRPPPSCFGDWRSIFLPVFCMRKVDIGRRKNDQRKRKRKKNIKNKKKTASLSDKMNAIMMSSRMEKERIGVIAKFLSATRRRKH